MLLPDQPELNSEILSQNKLKNPQTLSDMVMPISPHERWRQGDQEFTVILNLYNEFKPSQGFMRPWRNKVRSEKKGRKRKDGQDRAAHVK